MAGGPPWAGLIRVDALRCYLRAFLFYCRYRIIPSPNFPIVRSVPVLPSLSIVETLVFWEATGYAITYKQTNPYPYGVVTRNGSSLHFSRGVPGLTAESNVYSTCLVMVGDAEEVYADFCAKLKATMGRVPHKGIPRISRMKAGATRFTLTDVSGNSIIFIANGKRDQEEWEKANDRDVTKLQRAIANARRFRDYKIDYVSAMKVLDVALKKLDDESAEDIRTAVEMRTELADEAGEVVPEWVKGLKQF